MAALLASVALCAGTGCGGAGEHDATSSGRKARLVVFAAASMTEALRSCSARFEGADVRLSLDGSDKLAAQIRQGVKPDVYAAADTALPRELHRAGLLERPVRFASNELAVAVAQDSPIDSMDELAGADASLAIGSESVPVGAYTRRLFARLPRRTGKVLLARVRSEEPDVKGVVGKLTQGAVGAGVVYTTDVNATRGRLRAIPLPAGVQRAVAYAAAVGTGARNPGLARAYVEGLARGECRRALRDAGFGPPR